MRVLYIGNFEPPHSTENDIKSALENLGHEVDAWQEGSAADPPQFRGLDGHPDRPDLVLWTRTASLSSRWDLGDRWSMLLQCQRAGIPTVGYHLDRWLGLKRELEVIEDPFFMVDLLCTADGGHEKSWEFLGVNHHWMPPAIAGKNVGVGTPRAVYESDIAFVGNWQGGYHPEWKHREELVHWLSRTYGKRVLFWPRRGEHAIRGRELADLYASTKVVVGDSCLVPKADGSPMTHYCSDRIPETLGRGGLLVHPNVEGVTGTLFQHHWWPLNDWGELRRQIDTLVAEDDERRREYALSAMEKVREHHTYEVRMTQLFDELRKREMIA